MPIPFHCPVVYIAFMSQTNISDTLFRHDYTVEASDLNQYGIMHGGRLLTVCDEVAYVSAHKHAGCACLTRAVHQANFNMPAHENEILTISAQVGLTGLSSLWVDVNVINAHKIIMMDAVFVFVALDEHRQTQHVAPVYALSDAEKLLQKRLSRMKSQLNE